MLWCGDTGNNRGQPDGKKAMRLMLCLDPVVKVGV